MLALAVAAGLVAAGSAAGAGAPVAPPPAAPPSTVPAVQGGAPSTVPAVREWRPAPGVFRLRADARVVLPRGASRELRIEGSVLARDLGVGVGARGVRARAGDITLRLDPADRALGREGYRLGVGRVLSVAAPTTAGVFYGGRTLVQLLRERRSVPRGTARDRPLYRERGLMVDVGRRFFRPAWLERRIRALAALKLNVLHLHLSDDEGSGSRARRIPRPSPARRCESPTSAACSPSPGATTSRSCPRSTCPAICGPPCAAIPSCSSSTPSGAASPTSSTSRSPPLGASPPTCSTSTCGSSRDPSGTAAPTSTSVPSRPTPSTTATRAWPPSPAGATGCGPTARTPCSTSSPSCTAACAPPARTLRVWSDGIDGGGALRLNPGVSVQWWEERESPTPAELVRRGLRVVNSGWWPLYYVTGGPLLGLRPALEPFAREWRPWRFEGPFTARWGGAPGAPIYTLPRGDARQLGAELAVWNDDPDAPGAREDAVAAGIAPRLRILAERTWGG